MLIQVLCNRFDRIASYIEDEEVHFVLMQNGVYMLPQLLESVSAHRIVVLNTDWVASGLAHQGLMKDKQVHTISNAQWVGLCAEHKNVVTVQ